MAPTTGLQHMMLSLPEIRPPGLSSRPARGLSPDRQRPSRQRMNWQKASSYNTRSKVEAAISRYKRVIGDTLKSRHDTRRATDVAIAIKSLNRMNQLGRAIFTRIA